MFFKLCGNEDKAVMQQIINGIDLYDIFIFTMAYSQTFVIEDNQINPSFHFT